MATTELKQFGFFDATGFNEDGTPNLIYNAAEFAKAMDTIVGNCVTYDTAFPCDFTDTTDLNVKVGPGQAWIEGYWFNHTGETVVGLGQYKLENAEATGDVYLGIYCNVANSCFEFQLKRQVGLTDYFLPIERIKNLSSAQIASQIEHESVILEMTPVFRRYDTFSEITAEEIVELYNEVFGNGEAT